MSSSLNIQELLACLKNTYMATDKNIRSESEKKLLTLKEQNILYFTSQLIDLLKLSLNEIDKNLRMSIILLLKRSIDQKLKNYALDENTINQLIQSYITIIVSPNMDSKEIENFKETFLMLLDNTSCEILIEIIAYISKQIISMPLGSVNGVITILCSVVESSSIKKAKEFIIIVEGILNITSSILENLYDKYENVDQKNNLQDYFKLNNIFSSIYYLFFHSYIRFHKKYKIKNENISNIEEKISIIGFKLLVNLKVSDNNRIISWTGDKKYDKNINAMKINILKFLNLYVTAMGQIIMDKNKIENHGQLIKIIMANLEWIIMNKFIYLVKILSKDEYPDYHYIIIISCMFIYLKRILGKDNFIHEYTDHFNSMYKNILLPLLLISDIEEEIALDNEMFNGYLIDINEIIYKSKQKNIKSSIAGLMKVFYQKNINCNNFMIKYNISLLDYLINSNNDEDKSIFDKNDIIILLLKAYSKEKIISVLFLALNIFSEVNNYSNKAQNDKLLEKFYKNSFEPLTNEIKYPPLKHQFILFIKNYSLRFFDCDNIAFETSIKLLFTYLFEMEYLLISNSAADAIQFFFSDDIKGKEDRIKFTLLKIATKMSSNFERQIIEVQISNFFEVLYQIMVNFQSCDNEFFLRIFTNLCERVKLEVERHNRLRFIVKKEKNEAKKKASKQTNLNNYKIIINKCFNIIRLLINNKRFVDKNYQIIEESLKPLVAFMENPKKIDFDEDIIYIIYMLIILREKITGICFSLIKNLHKYIDKTKGLFPDSYQLINAYLAYGTDQILANKVWYEGLFSAFKSGLKFDDFNKSGLYTCILIQTWIINCSKIPNEYLSNLVSDIIKKIKIIINNFKSSNSKYMGEERYSFLGYVTLILSGLINYSSIIIPALQEAKADESLKNWLKIIVKENEVIYEYEIKIIIYSICMIIQKKVILGDIQYLLNICVDLLKCQEKNGKYELKKKTRKFLNLAFVDDDDEEDNSNEKNSEEDEEYMDYKEMKEIVKKTINPIKDLDEFKTFNDLLIDLKNNRNDIFSLWENSLNEEKKTDVKNLFEVKRINIQFNSNKSMNVPRRIVAIKRNKNNTNSL